MTTAPSAVDIVMELEQTHQWFAPAVNGWSPWRVLRGQILRQLAPLTMQTSGPSNLVRALNAIPQALRLVVALIAGQRREILVKTSRSALRLRDGARFRDIYVDDLIDRVSSYFKIEDVSSAHFDAQAKAMVWKAHLESSLFLVFGVLLAKIRPLRQVEAFCATVANTLASRGLDVDARWLVSRVSNAHWQAWLYGLLLDRLKPSAVFVNDTSEFGLLIACKKRKIKFIEIQHGVFNERHPESVPLSTQGDDGHLLLPDVLASFGDYWIDKLATTRMGQERAVAVGNGILNHAIAQQQPYAPERPCKIVVTSQGLDSERFGSWLEKVVAAAPEGLNWSMWIKLHPAYDTDGGPLAALQRFEEVSLVGPGDPTTVYDLLVDATVHVSIGSACHFDALAMGVPTISVPLLSHEDVLDAINGQEFQLVSDPAQVWTIARDLTLHQRAEQAASRYTAPHFGDNLRALVPIDQPAVKAI